MNVLVDTSVWSLALRRAKRVDQGAAGELGELIQEGRVVMVGAIRQELLSGIKVASQFESLREHLRAFPDIELDRSDYEEAAQAFNRCRERGVQGSNTDFLLCAIALRRDLAIYTTDGDFKHYARVLGLALHEPRA
jgi:predicted nucleic acid-binding protein